MPALLNLYIVADANVLNFYQYKIRIKTYA